MLEYKTFPFLQVKQGDGGTIEGYAAVFHNVDLGGDVIEPGAFAKSILERGPTGIGVFIGHDHGALPIGVPVKLKEDAHGLFTVTRMFESTRAQDVIATAKGLDEAGLSLGMSIGYRPIDVEFEEVDGETIRHLKEVDVREYSFVGMPMNELACVTDSKADCLACGRPSPHPLLAAVKANMSASDLLPLLTNAATLIKADLASRSEYRIRAAQLRLAGS